MAVPQRVPIACEAGYRTDTIGSYRDGQFYAAVHGAHRDDDHAPDWEGERVRWYAYLHQFDADGNHCKSEISLIGVAPNLRGDLGEQAGLRMVTVDARGGR
jgi:formate hydrogenlyase regulatory protein HycA